MCLFIVFILQKTTNKKNYVLEDEYLNKLNLTWTELSMTILTEFLFVSPNPIWESHTHKSREHMQVCGLRKLSNCVQTQDDKLQTQPIVSTPL